MNKNMVDGVREYYSLPSSVSDEQISSQLSESVGASMVALRIAKSDLMEAIKALMPDWLKKRI